MSALRRFTKLAVPTVSAVGGVLHNAGQIIVAACVTRTVQIAWYFPVLVVTGTVAGIVIGLVGALLVSRVKL
jgi:heptaprenyl diphosphate synthase